MKETADEKLLRQYQMMVDVKAEPQNKWLTLLEQQKAKMDKEHWNEKVQKAT